MKNEFLFHFFTLLVNGCLEYQFKNIDYNHPGLDFKKKITSRLNDYLYHVVNKIGLVPGYKKKKHLQHVLAIYLSNIEALTRVYNWLQDEYSRGLYVQLLTYKILGKNHVRLKTNNPDYWQKYREADKKYLKKRRSIKTKRFYLKKYEVTDVPDAPIIVNSLSVHMIFSLGQYEYTRDNVNIMPESGNIVIDAGACWGESTLCFASKVGNKGKILALEFEEENLHIFNTNLKLNQHLAERIELVRKALWNETGITLNHSSRGPSTRTYQAGGMNKREKVKTVTIDALLKQKKNTTC